MQNMRRFVVFAIVLAAARARDQFDNSLDEQWEAFKEQYGKEYGGYAEEEQRRLAWEDNVDYIRKHNLEYDTGRHTYWLGMNEHCDLSHQERLDMLSTLNVADDIDNKNLEIFQPPQNFKLPTHVDWGARGYVTDVKNELRCGSPWAFSAIGALEGQWKKKTGKLVSLSAQQLVDCSRDRKYRCQGCEGGWPAGALRYISDMGGIESNTSYVYKGVDQTCHFNKSAIVAKVKSVVSLRSGSEMKLAIAVAANGPVSAAMDSSHPSFSLYKGGIYDEPNCKSNNSDHTGVVTGYGPSYWIVKNCWGTTWGDKGYIKMSRGKNNQCGIASIVDFPRV